MGVCKHCATFWKGLEHLPMLISSRDREQSPVATEDHCACNGLSHVRDIWCPSQTEQAQMLQAGR